MQLGPDLCLGGCGSLYLLSHRTACVSEEEVSSYNSTTQQTASFSNECREAAIKFDALLTTLATTVKRPYLRHISQTPSRKCLLPQFTPWRRPYSHS